MASRMVAVWHRSHFDFAWAKTVSNKCKIYYKESGACYDDS